MTRSVGIILSIPVIISIWESKQWRICSFSITNTLLIGGIPIIFLGLYMLYQKQYGSHPTGYFETFLLLDPYDSSKGILTWHSFLERTYWHAISTTNFLSKAIISAGLPGALNTSSFLNTSIRAFSFILAVILIIASFVTSRRSLLIILPFAFIYMLIIILWPYSDPRFALPLVPVATLGFVKVCSYILRHFSRSWKYALLCLFVGYLGMNMTSMIKIAQSEATKRSEVHKHFKELTIWSTNNIPVYEAIASFDYREHSLRLNRSVQPLYYSSDNDTHISSLIKNNISWLIISDAIYYLRGIYGHSLVSYLNKKAELVHKNSLFEVYRLNGLAENS